MKKKQKESESILQKDISQHMVVTVAVFGLVVSSLVAVLGVATLGVQAQVAFAQYQDTGAQSAAAFMTDHMMPPPRPTLFSSSTRPQSDTSAPSTTASGTRAPLPMASSTHPMMGRPNDMASTTREGESPMGDMHMMASSSAMFCPRILQPLVRGSQDASSSEDVRSLQEFIVSHYGLNASSTVTGYFGSTTAAYVEKFQQEQGIPPAPMVGKLTLAAISRLCAGGLPNGEHPSMGSSTMSQGGMHDSMRASSSTMQTASGTPPMMPPPHRILPPASTTPGVSLQNYEGASNAANALSALGEIGDGFSKLLQASSALVGL